MICVAHLSHTRSCIAFPSLHQSPSHYFKSVTCVCSVIFFLQRRCTGCCVPFSDPRCFLPVTVYGTTHTHLVHMCWLLLWGLHQMGSMFCHIRCMRPGGVTQVDHESAQLSRLEAVVIASSKSLHLCSVCLHQWRAPLFALKYPCNLPPHMGGGGLSLGNRLPPGWGGRPSHATGGDFKGGGASKPCSACFRQYLCVFYGYWVCVCGVCVCVCVSQGIGTQPFAVFHPGQFQDGSLQNFISLTL